MQRNPATPCSGETQQALGPPRGDLLGNARIVKPRIGGVGMVERKPRIDPLVGDFADVKPAGIGLRQVGVRRRATDHDIGEEAEPILPAQTGQFGKGFVGRLAVLRRVKRRMNRLVTAGEEDIARLARREQRRSEDIIEAVVAAAAKMIAPGRTRPGQQRMKVVNFRCEQVAGFSRF